METGELAKRPDVSLSNSVEHSVGEGRSMIRKISDGMNFKTVLLFRLTTTDDSQWLHDGLCFFGCCCESDWFSVAQQFLAEAPSDACFEVDIEEPQTQ